MRCDGVSVRECPLSVFIVKNCLYSLGSRSKKRMTGLNSSAPVAALTERTESPMDTSLSFFLNPSDVITVALAEKQPKKMPRMLYESTKVGRVVLF